MWVGSVVFQIGFKCTSALLTILPLIAVTFAVMPTTEGQSSMVAMAAIPGEGKHPILVFIIANPVVTTFCFG